MKTREDMEAAVRQELGEAAKRELSEGSATIGGLTPLSIWEFEGIRDDETPGILVPCPDDDLNDEQLREDAAMLRSMYDEVLLQVEGGPQDAVVACAAMIWDEKPRELATILSTYDAFEGAGKELTVQDALGSLALAMQASFDFGRNEGMHARFNYADAIQLAAKHLQMKYRTQEAEGERRVLPFTLLRPTFDIPVPSYVDCAPALFSTYCIDVLKRTGRTLLSFLFSD